MALFCKENKNWLFLYNLALYGKAIEYKNGMEVEVIRKWIMDMHVVPPMNQNKISIDRKGN